MPSKNRSTTTRFSRQVKSIDSMRKTHPIKDAGQRARFIRYFDERVKMASTPTERYIAERNRMIVLTGLYTGLRAEDLLQLKVRQVSAGELLDEVENKTGKEQHYQLPAKYFAEVVKYIRNNFLDENDYMFRSRNHKAQTSKDMIVAVTRQNVDRVIAKACEFAGIRHKVGMHGLRKTFGYCCITRWGFSPEDVRVFLNHSSVATTEHYIEWSMGDVGMARSGMNYDF